MQVLVLNINANTLFFPSLFPPFLSSSLLQVATFSLNNASLPLVMWTWWEIDLCKIHEFITFEDIFHCWIYWAVIRIQRWTELEDIFKVAKEITGKPMRLVALLQHPWNPFSVPLQQCKMMSVKMGCHASPPAIYFIYSGISVKNKWCYNKNLQDLS